MATIIDALIVELGLDAGDLQKKTPGSVADLKKLESQGEKTEKSVKGIGKSSKETARNVGDLTRVVTTLLSVIGGTMAIKAFVSDFIDSSAAIERLSKNLGLSITNISAWSTATERLGGSAQGLQATLTMLSREQTNLLLKGESGLIPFFSLMGVAMADAAGKARPVTALLADMASFAEGKDRPTMHNMFASMGIDEGTINLILLGRKELELRIKRQKEFGDQVAKFAPLATKFQDQLVGISQKFKLLGLQLLTDAAPTLEKIFGLIENFGNWCQQNIEFIEDFFKVLALGLGAVALASLPIDLLVVSVVALAAAIALLWQDYQVWARGGQSEFDWSKFAHGIEWTKDKTAELVTELKNLYSAWERWMNRGHENDPGWIGIPQNKNKGTTIDPVTKQRVPAAIGAGSSALSSKYMDYFKKQGWSAADAASIAAQLIGENASGNPSLTGDKGTAVGIAQWRGSRQADFKKLYGIDMSKATQEQQLAFVQYELTKGNYAGVGTALRNASSIQDKSNILTAQYERPKDVSGDASARGSYAQALAGIPGAASAAANAPQAGGGSGTSIDKSIKTDIGTINIQTQATDADGIAKDIEHSFDYLFAGQFNYGLN